MADHDDDGDWDEDLPDDGDPYDDLSDDLDDDLTHGLDDAIGMGEAEPLAFDPPAFEPQPAVYAPSSFRSDGLSSLRDRGPAVDEHGRLVGHVDCRNCGYNLRGQPLDGACSECGAAIEWSAKGDRLCYCDPKWIGSLKSGMTWFIIAIIGSFALGLIGFAIGFAVQMSQSGLAPTQQGNQPGFNQMMQSQQGMNATVAVNIALGLISTALFLIAVIQLTRPEPGKNDESPLSSRQIFRVGWIISAALSITGNVLIFAIPILGTVVGAISGIISIVAFFAMFIYLRKLALRIPDDALASQTRTVMWGIVIGYGVIVVGGVLTALTFAALAGGNPSVVGLMMIGGCVFGIAGLAVLGFGIWGFVLTFFYRSQFAKAEAIAIDSRS